MAIDHVSVGVANMKRAKAFYDAALEPLGMKPIYPVEIGGQLVRNEETWKTWESGFGGIAEEVVQYKENLLKLKGIVVDYGINDENPWIPKGSEYYGEQLNAAGIPVKVESYEGNHFNQIGERIREHMLPFFSTLLTFD